MENFTDREKELIEIIRKNPTLEQAEIAKRLGVTRSSVAGHISRLIKKGYVKRGYIFNSKVHGISVVGGANVDIKGIADTSFAHGSSNPGTIYRSVGGVARNVAENLARLDLPTTLFSVVGLDHEGEWLLEVTSKAGVNIDYVKTLKNARTGTYLSVLDQNKEQIGSISDMSIMERFDQELLSKFIPQMITSSIIFMDTNIPLDSLNFMFRSLDTNNNTIIVDPVSVKKAHKIKDYLMQIDILTPNKEEAEELTGIKINNEDDLRSAATQLFTYGVKQVVITLGSKGVYIANKQNQEFMKSPNVDVLDTTGAGDAFVAGIMYGIYKEKNIFEACKYGHTMAAITLNRKETVATNLSNQLLENIVKELFNE